ncbi:hypothetical protein RclHR1_00110002 [Rhizophagus clarus]|uniref:Uncharacterized protein n=1 Tax=Rhizophagus clarus TaxID=94130 RepID=A0A2Z6QF72_9GLOM|nr:hypothetical protein RclHR1_00110002 [Rhizophagus clarus]GES98027.1 hypothetical protein GLOIN_2v1880782 [Rhizophagus clarus]
MTSTSVSSNVAYETNLQTAATQAYNTPFSYSNNDDNPISDQQPMLNDNVNYCPDYNHQQSNVTSPKHDHQLQYQYTQQPGISNNNVTITPNHNDHHKYQQSTSNVASSNNVTSGNNHHDSSNTSHYNYQQPTPNQNQHNPDFLPLLNHSGISINSISFPHATIIILPTTNSDSQNQLQQILAHLNHSSTNS